MPITTPWTVRARSGKRAYTISLLHCDGADASTTIIDEVTGNTALVTSLSQLDTEYSKFGTAACMGTTTNDGIISTFPSTYTPSGGVSDKWTLELWIHKASLTTGFNPDVDFLISGSAASNFGCLVAATTGAITIQQTVLDSSFVALAQDLTTVIGTYTADTWMHYAVVRSGTVTTTYLDGTSVHTLDYATGVPGPYNAIRLRVDANSHFDEARLSHMLRYTVNFTSPTVAFTLD